MNDKEILTIVIAIISPILTTFLAFCWGRRADNLKLKDRQKGLIDTFICDSETWSSRYNTSIKPILNADIPTPNSLPCILLIQPSFNFFAVFDGKIKDIDILEHDTQLSIIKFYQAAKSFYNELLAYSRMLDEMRQTAEEVGLQVYITRHEGTPSIIDIDEHEVEKKSKLIDGSVKPGVARFILLVMNLKTHLSYLRDRSVEVYHLYTEMSDKLKKQAQ
jgi:hypothetical protein